MFKNKWKCYTLLTRQYIGSQHDFLHDDTNHMTPVKNNKIFQFLSVYHYQQCTTGTTDQLIQSSYTLRDNYSHFSAAEIRFEISSNMLNAMHQVPLLGIYLLH